MTSPTTVRICIGGRGNWRDVAAPRRFGAWAVTQHVDAVGPVPRRFEVTHVRTGIACRPKAGGVAKAKAVRLARIMHRELGEPWPRSRFGVRPRMTKAFLARARALTASVYGP